MRAVGVVKGRCVVDLDGRWIFPQIYMSSKIKTKVLLQYDALIDDVVFYYFCNPDKAPRVALLSSFTQTLRVR